MRDYFFNEASGKSVDDRNKAYEKYSALELVRLRAAAKTKFRHMGGAGMRLLASMLEHDPAKRFDLSMLDRHSKKFNSEFAE